MKELNGYVKHTLDVAQAAGEDLAPYLALLGVGYTDLGETEDCVEQATYNCDLLIARRPNEGLGPRWLWRLNTGSWIIGLRYVRQRES